MIINILQGQLYLPTPTPTPGNISSESINNLINESQKLINESQELITNNNLYTDIEKGLFTVRPGITDFSSIVFSDEGEILEGKKNPDLSYNQLIRPWKSRLGLAYIENQSFFLDIQIILLANINLLQ